MGTQLKLVKTGCTQDYLKGCNIKYLTSFSCKKLKDDGRYLLVDVDLDKSHSIGNTFILASMKIRDEFKTVLLDTDEDTKIVLHEGKVYKEVDDLEYSAFAGLFRSSAV
jgi:hypothetical protein